MVSGQTQIDNLPRLSDVDCMAEVLKELGCELEFLAQRRRLKLAAKASYGHCQPSAELVTRIRGSILLLGPILATGGSLTMDFPGGDAIGERRIDCHIRALRRMGAKVEAASGKLWASCPKAGLRGAEIELPMPTVTGTENILMASCRALGVTHLKGAAREPEVVDLANFLNRAGADIRGAGSSEIEIIGSPKPLRETAYSLIGDRIEAGTYLLAAAMTRGDITVKGVNPLHLKRFLQLIAKTGATLSAKQKGRQPGWEVRLVMKKTRPKPVDFATAPYPGIATDLQAQIGALNCLAKGSSRITETVFEGRFQHFFELRKFAAKVVVAGRDAQIEGVSQLTPAQARCTDLRAGASLVLAALAADGESEVSDIYHLDRGYDDMEYKLAALGAKITRQTPP